MVHLGHRPKNRHLWPHDSLSANILRCHGHILKSLLLSPNPTIYSIRYSKIYSNSANGLYYNNGLFIEGLLQYICAALSFLFKPITLYASSAEICQRMLRALHPNLWSACWFNSNWGRQRDIQDIIRHLWEAQNKAANPPHPEEPPEVAPPSSHQGQTVPWETVEKVKERQQHLATSGVER